MTGIVTPKRAALRSTMQPRRTPSCTATSAVCLHFATSGDANTAGLSRFEGFNRFLTVSGLKHIFARLVPSGLKRYALGWYYRSDGVPALTDQERHELAAILEEVSAARQG